MKLQFGEDLDYFLSSPRILRAYILGGARFVHCGNGGLGQI